MIEVRRRDFVLLLGGATTWPLAAGAQQTMPVVGYLGAESPELFATRLAAFRQGLRASGYEEGRNVAIEYRWAEGHNDRLPDLAADLVKRHVTVLAAPGSVAAALAAKAATMTIPIVFEMGADPIAVGLVDSLSRPSGNVTGVTSLNAQVAPKRLEMLHELLPQAKVFSLLVNPTNPKNAAETSASLQAAAHTLGLDLHVFNAAGEGDFDIAFAALAKLPAAGLVIANETFFANRSERLAALATRYAMPAVHQSREFVLAGGLMSYGGSIKQSHTVAGAYTGRILAGAKPADLPVQQVTKVEMAVNLKAAKALGIAFPASLLALSDDVIE
jgi:putative tryptophan/tyrosine transport system substrate-binding protein